MIQEVLATVLMTCAIGTPLMPKRAQTEYNTIYGFYNLKDTLGHMDNASVSIGSPDNPLDYYVYSIDEDMYIKMNNLVISQNQTNNVWYYSVACLNYNVDTGTLTDQYVATVTGQELEDGDNKAKNLLLYFPYKYNIESTNGNYTRIMEFITQENNAFMHSFTGWYYMANAPTSTNFELLGTMMVNNQLVYGLISYDGDLQAGAPQYLQPSIENPMFDVYSNNKWQIKDRNMYFTINKIPNKVYDQLSTLGTWTYIPGVPQETTFNEFFFSIMDAPLYFITSLFSFELFGVELYVAFTSLITLAIIIIIIKKVM